MHRPSIVIVGAGFGGLAAAQALKRADADVLIVDRRNYHLFQPLLYQVATAGLSPADIAQPVRGILRGQENARFRMGEVVGVDWDAKTLRLADGEIAWDALILAPGGETNFFGDTELRARAFGLKGIEDALAIRDHVLTCFELSTHEPDRARRQALLTFVVAGGGPTGVECAGAISELVRLVLKKDFPDFDVDDVRVIVVEGGPALLPGFPPKLATRAVELLRAKAVEVRLDQQVAAFETGDDDGYVLLKNGERITARTLVWAAGVRAVSLLETLGLAVAKQGRARVGATLEVAEKPGVFVIGDAAYLEVEGQGGQALPMLAPVAMEQGKLAARNALARCAGRALEPYEYRDRGTLATIGRNAAVARIGKWEFAGRFAWFVWLVVHVVQLVSFRDKVLVLVNWAWDYFFYDRAVRLIHPKRGDATEPVPAHEGPNRIASSAPARRPGP